MTAGRIQSACCPNRELRMARCDRCGQIIVAGAMRHGDGAYCGERCLQKFVAAALSLAQVSDEEVARRAREVFDGLCPRCMGPGPVDVRTSHIAWGALILSGTSSSPVICCRSCGVRRQMAGLAATFVAGWWSIPWGLINAPVQIARNIGDMMRKQTEPTPELIAAIRLELALSRGKRTEPDEPVL